MCWTCGQRQTTWSGYAIPANAMVRGKSFDAHAQHVITRKSSCVNARGIPTAAYQVLHLLPKVGSPPLRQGYTHPPARSDSGGYPRWGNPPTRGTPPQHRSPSARSDGGYPRWGTPPGRGTPPPAWTWPGYPPPPPVRTDRMMDGQTHVKTVGNHSRGRKAEPYYPEQ